MTLRARRSTCPRQAQLQTICLKSRVLAAEEETRRRAVNVGKRCGKALDITLPKVILGIVVWRLKSTYTDKLPLMINETGRVHTSYHQAVAATDVLSSTDPEPANIPVRNEEGAAAFVSIAPDDISSCSADFSTD